MTKEELFAIADNPIEFRMGKYMSEGFEIYKKNIGGFIGLLILSFVLYIGLAIIPLIGPLAAPFLIILIHSGVLIVFKKLKGNETVQFNDFFSGFKSAGSIITLGIILFLVFLLSFVPAFLFLFNTLFSSGNFMSFDPARMAGLGNELNSMVWILLLFYVPVIFVMVIYVFSLHVLLFINDNFWVAMEGSRKIVFKKFFPILGMLILIYFISVLATIFTLGLGLFVVIPWFNATIYAAFDDIYKPNTNSFDNKIDSFGSFQKDLNTEAEEKSL